MKIISEILQKKLQCLGKWGENNSTFISRFPKNTLKKAILYLVNFNYTQIKIGVIVSVIQLEFENL